MARRGWPGGAAAWAARRARRRRTLRAQRRSAASFPRAWLTVARPGGAVETELTDPSSVDEQRHDLREVCAHAEHRLAVLDHAALRGAKLRKRGTAEQECAERRDRGLVADDQHGL